jgi:DNA-binding GntR family transcriptional regulator
MFCMYNVCMVAINEGEDNQGLSLKRTSAAEQVVDLLREKILSGEFPPGMVIREIPLSSTIGVSRSTLREAIRLLGYEGLLRINFHRTVAVTMLSVGDVDDIYSARRTLELSAIEAISGAAPERIRPLGEIVRMLAFAVEAKNWPEASRFDMSFHRELVSFLGSARLNRFFGTLLGELRLGLILVDSASSETDRLVASHRELFELLLGARYGECREALRRHLADGQLEVAAAVANRAIPT